MQGLLDTPEEVVVAALKDFPQGSQFADADVVGTVFDMGVEVPGHIDPQQL